MELVYLALFDKTVSMAPQYLIKTTLAKKHRGSYDFATDGKNLVVSWLDSKAVTCATNYVTCNPVSTTQQWSKSAKKRVYVPMLKPFEYCNKEMGGADLFDQLCPHIEFALGQRNGGGLSLHGR